MRVIRKLFFFCLAGLLVWLGIFTYNRLTDGFSIYQMSSSLPPYPQFEVAITEEKKGELNSLLDQKFHYIGKGCQFYVFASEDGQCVLKFLKHKHLRPFTWLKQVPMTAKWRALADAKSARRKERVERLFSSCKLAYEKMPEETGLLYIHLNRCAALGKKVTLIDKIGFKHTVAVDDHEFCIQKKAISVQEMFSKLQAEEVPQKVQQLADLVLARCEKGICDRDRSFTQNVAFLEDKAIFIDVGQFYEDPIILEPKSQAEDLKKRINNLRAWTEKRFPLLAPLIFQVL